MGLLHGLQQCFDIADSADRANGQVAGGQLGHSYYDANTVSRLIEYFRAHLNILYFCRKHINVRALVDPSQHFKGLVSRLEPRCATRAADPSIIGDEVTGVWKQANRAFSEQLMLGAQGARGVEDRATGKLAKV